MRHEPVIPFFAENSKLGSELSFPRSHGGLKAGNDGRGIGAPGTIVVNEPSHDAFERLELPEFVGAHFFVGRQAGIVHDAIIAAPAQEQQPQWPVEKAARICPVFPHITGEAE